MTIKLNKYAKIDEIMQKLFCEPNEYHTFLNGEYMGKVDDYSYNPLLILSQKEKPIVGDTYKKNIKTMVLINEEKEEIHLLKKSNQKPFYKWRIHTLDSMKDVEYALISAIHWQDKLNKIKNTEVKNMTIKKINKENNNYNSNIGKHSEEEIEIIDSNTLETKINEIIKTPGFKMYFVNDIWVNIDTMVITDDKISAYSADEIWIFDCYLQSLNSISVAIEDENSTHTHWVHMYIDIE